MSTASVMSSTRISEGVLFDKTVKFFSIMIISIILLLGSTRRTSLVNGLDLQFTDCHDSQVTALRSPTCQGDPCRVPIGGFASLEMEFVPQTDAKDISINVFASVFGFEVSLPLDDTDACASGRLNCPVKAGVPQTLKYDLVVKDTYYPVAGDVGFRLTSEDGSTIACASISAELYAPNEDELKFPEEEKEVDHQEL